MPSTSAPDMSYTSADVSKASHPTAVSTTPEILLESSCDTSYVSNASHPAAVSTPPEILLEFSCDTGQKTRHYIIDS